MHRESLPTFRPGARVPRAFWHGPVLDRAQLALGMVLARRRQDVVQRGRIVEVEAYGGSDDPASHAYRGETPRNAVMFGPAGAAYVYFIYGMHFCFNIVTGAVGEPAAILVRALEPVAHVAGRTDGPARLCAALGIDRQLNGHPLDGDALWLEAPARPLPPDRIVRGPRIGLNPKSPAAHRPWRLHIDGSAHSRAPTRESHAGRQ